MSRFQFIDDARDTYPVKWLCKVLEVARSSYYAWVAGRPGREARHRADEELSQRIRRIQDPKQDGDRAYGAPRVTAELNDSVPAGQRVNHKRVARVMRERGLAGIRLRKRVRTTIPEPADQKVPDLVSRDFTAEEPNRLYVGDITYLPLADGRNWYLATVIDCCSRKLAGWALADHMRVGLVEDALRDAAATRGSLAGAVFHSDHGSVYTSKAYAGLCNELGVTQSMGAVGTSADNALAESFNAALKRETLAGDTVFQDEHECRRAVFKWVNRYNTKRRHSYCGNVSPNTYENQYAEKGSLINHPRVHTPGRRPGCFWLPTRPDTICALNAHGGLITFGSAGDWNDAPKTHLIVTGTEDLHSRVDRRPLIEEAFSRCLLTQGETRSLSWAGVSDGLGDWFE